MSRNDVSKYGSKTARTDGMVAAILKDVPLPKMCRLRQKFDPARIEDIEATVRAELRRPGTLDRIRPGTKVALTAGSRGIANIALILKVLGEEIRRAGGKPFIVPAMGSHGGCTAAGQKKVLEDYGITEASTGCPVRSTMETVVVAETASGMPVHLDRYAAEAGGIVVVNRIKYHTAFRGRIESGLLKMITIGLGKQKGAETCHNLGLRVMERNLIDVSLAALPARPFLFGLGTIENAYDETRTIRAIPAEAIPDEEPALLEEAKEHMPSIPFAEIDVLVVDELGKNISGGGMDPNVTGSFVDPAMKGGIRAGRTVVLDLTEETRGNATGIGRADFTTQRAFDKFDFEATYPNIITPTIVPPGKIPIVLANDRLAVQAALKTCAGVDPSKARIVRIKNSLEIETLLISEALLEEARVNERVVEVGPAEEMRFDGKGVLKPLDR
jgi:hypothetical protein